MNKYRGPFLLALDDFSSIFPHRITTEDLGEFISSLKNWGTSILIAAQNPDRSLLPVPGNSSIFDITVNTRLTPSRDGQVQLLSLFPAADRKEFSLLLEGKEENGKYFFSWKIQEVEKLN